MREEEVREEEEEEGKQDVKRKKIKKKNTVPPKVHQADSGEHGTLPTIPELNLCLAFSLSSYIICRISTRVST